MTKPKKKPKKLPVLDHCAAQRDGECFHEQCPQLKDWKPVCPLDRGAEDYYE